MTPQSMKPNRTFAILFATLAPLLHAAGCASTATTPRASASAEPAATPPTEAVTPRARSIDRDLALATFDEAWSIVERTHFDPEYNGVDWHAVRDELRPKAEQVRTTIELRRLVQEMVGRLGQSHFGLLPDEFIDAVDAADEWTEGESVQPSTARVDEGTRPRRRPRAEPERPGEVGFDVRLVEDQVVVTAVTPGSPADEAGIRPGWILSAVGSRDVNRLLSLAPDSLDERMKERYVWQGVLSQLTGESGSKATVTLLDEHDSPREVELTRVPVAGERIKFGDLPTFYAHLTHERIALGDSPHAIGFIAFNVWMVPMSQPFAEAVDALRDMDGIIIDLRGNPGGVGGMVMGVAGHFLDDRLALGTMMTRDTQLNFVANPRRVSTDGRRVEPFSGPLAILVDAQTGSTSEIFAAGMQALGRARVFGQTTMGAALPAMMTTLPNGDVLMHAIADFVDPNGEQVEGRGVVPDVPAPPTRSDLLAGRDAAREAAIDWIRSRVAERSESARR